MNKHRIQRQLLLVCTLIISTCHTGCSDGDSVEDNSGNNGDAAQLQIFTPKTIYSKSDTTGSGYVVINNPTDTIVKNLRYSLHNIVSGASGASIDPDSANNCAVIKPHSRCNIKITVPVDATAGSLNFTVSNTGTNLFNSRSSLLAQAATPATTIGIGQATYNTASGADGITLNYYHTVINGTPFIVISGLVASATAGNFNKIVLVNDSGTELLNQELIGELSNTQGSTFNILLPVPTGNNITQTIKVQTRQITNGTATVISTANASSTLTTKENIGIAELLPSAIHLTASNPEQTITIVNIGDTAAQLQELISNNQNVKVVFSSSSLPSATATTATLELKDTTVVATTGNITLTYNNGQTQASTSAVVDQNLNKPPPLPPAPTAGLTAIFSPSNNFFTTTATGTVNRQITLTNSGNTTEDNIILTLPANFTISSGTNHSCTVVQSTSPATLSDSLTAQTGSCDVTATYNNPSMVDPAQTDHISIAYHYNNGQTATPAIAAINYRVTQSTANLQISPSSYDFGSIVGNNSDSSSDVLFTITNTGDGTASSFGLSLTGADSSMFTLNDNGITAGETCSALVPALLTNQTCKVNVTFGPTSAVVNPASATLAASYIPYSAQPSTHADSTLSGISVTPTSASINISNPAGSGFISGTDGSSGNPYTVLAGTPATLTYTHTNTGMQAANSFYVSNSSLPAGWARTGGTCPADSGTAISLSNTTGNNSCTVEFTINSSTAAVNNFNQNVMTAHWTDLANPSGKDQPASSSETYVTVIPPLSITISNISGNTPASVMGTVPITFDAAISGGLSGDTSTVTAVLANSVTATILSNPSPCTLTVGGATTSCSFVITPWYTGFDSSTVGLTNYDPFTPANTSIGLSATNVATISGVTSNQIDYSIVTPYVYLMATAPGDTATAGVGVTYGSGGSVNPRFTDGTQNGGGTCANSRKDNLTGVEWLTNANALCPTTCTWSDTAAAGSAQEATVNFNNGGGACGYTDWRLPTEHELQTLYNYSVANADLSIWLGAQGFTGIANGNPQSSGYWAGTPSSGNFTWRVYLGSGGGYTARARRDQNNYAWPVRGSNTTVAKDAPGNTATAGPGKEWPATRFTADTSGNCMVDHLTGLVWPKNVNLLGTAIWGDSSTSGTAQYKIAQMNTTSGAPGYQLCGYADWRMPNINELQALFNYAATGGNSSVWLGTQNFTGNGPGGIPASTVFSSAVNSGNYLIFALGSGQANLYPPTYAGNVNVVPVRGGQ